MNLLIEADDENDSCYIGLGGSLEPGAVSRTIKVTEDLSLDFDIAGHLVGIDIMNASRVLPETKGEPALDSLLGTKEAADLAGVRPSNFVRDYANRPDFPKPAVELSTGRVWRRTDVVNYLERRRKRAS